MGIATRLGRYSTQRKHILMATANQRNKRIFFIVFFVFVAVVIALTVDMARRTTAPWNKKKQVIRAWDGDDSTAVQPDTLPAALPR